MRVPNGTGPDCDARQRCGVRQGSGVVLRLQAARVSERETLNQCRGRTRGESRIVQQPRGGLDPEGRPEQWSCERWFCPTGNVAHEVLHCAAHRRVRLAPARGALPWLRQTNHAAAALSSRISEPAPAATIWSMRTLPASTQMPKKFT